MEELSSSVENRDFDRRLSAPTSFAVMGSHLIAEGGLQLQLPLAPRVGVALRKRQDHVLQITGPDQSYVRLALKLRSLAQEKEGQRFRERWVQETGSTTGLETAACWWMLQQTFPFPFSGIDFFLTTELALHPGLESLAPHLIACLVGLQELYQLPLMGLEMVEFAAQICEQVLEVSPPYPELAAAYLGESRRLLPLFAEPLEAYPSIALAENLLFVALEGLPSGDFASLHKARQAAQIGYLLIAQHEGATEAELQRALIDQQWKDLPYGGQLSQIPVAEFEDRYAPWLPEQISGMSLKEHHPISRLATGEIQEKQHYAIGPATRIPIYEQARSSRFMSILGKLNTAGSSSRLQVGMEALGEMMYASHQSARSLGLVPTLTDTLFSWAWQAGPKAGIYGAKICPGPSGDLLCLLCDGERGLESAQRLQERFSRLHQSSLSLFVESSSGAFF